MGTALIIDFGSTYTKLRAIDLDQAEVIGSGQGPSTVTTNINHGLDLALDSLERAMGELPDFEYRLASSSAAGGLGMVTIGLVPRLTAQAARFAALGAGAKLLANFSFELTSGDIHKIEGLKPDILLLCGGTDGGNKAIYLANARLLAQSSVDCPFVLAGNRSASDEAARVLNGAEKITVTSENVMPEYLKLNIEPAREAIRGIFIQHIVNAKGIDQAKDRFDAVLMPTPAAVLSAAELLSHGTPNIEGLGPLLVVDVGGATTDVHSICDGSPCEPGVVQLGLEEPFSKRTVEGDLGMRHTADYIVEMMEKSDFAQFVGLDHETVFEMLARCTNDVEWLPQTAKEIVFDTALSQMAIKLSVERHAGHHTIVQTVHGPATVQHGKDLTRVRTIIGTGGVLSHGNDPATSLSGALRDRERSKALYPCNARLFLDEAYILYTCGLLRECEPEVAMRLALKSLKSLELEVSDGIRA